MISSSLVDCSSSLEVSSSSLTDWSSSFIDIISSFEAFISSLELSSSSMVPWRSSRVALSSFSSWLNSERFLDRFRRASEANAVRLEAVLEDHQQQLALLLRLREGLDGDLAGKVACRPASRGRRHR